MKYAASFLLIAIALSAPPPAFGWAWSVHRLIAFRAMQSLSRELPLPESRAWPLLHDGAVAPDSRKNPGYLPAEDHVFHVTPDPAGRRFGRAPRRIQELTWKLMAEPVRDEVLIFELGRLCHLVADLCQPLHADGKRRNPREDEVHAPFERDADRDPRLARIAAPALAAIDLAGAAAGPSSWEARMEEVARISVRDYDALCAAYLSGKKYEQVADRTRGWVDRSIRETVALWKVILARRGSERRKREDAARWAWIAVPFVLWVWSIRGRMNEDPSRYPYEGKRNFRKEREASDRAYAKLEKRFGLKPHGPT